MTIVCNSQQATQHISSINLYFSLNNMNWNIEMCLTIQVINLWKSETSNWSRISRVYGHRMWQSPISIMYVKVNVLLYYQPSFAKRSRLLKERFSIIRHTIVDVIPVRTSWYWTVLLDNGNMVHKIMKFLKLSNSIQKIF